MQGKISIKDAILELRTQLQDAAQAAEGEELIFKVDSIELELSISAETKTSAEGKVNWWVLSGTGKHEFSDNYHHKIKLNLNIGALYVSDQTKTK